MSEQGLLARSFQSDCRTDSAEAAFFLPSDKLTSASFRNHKCIIKGSGVVVVFFPFPLQSLSPL